MTDIAAYLQSIKTQPGSGTILNGPFGIADTQGFNFLPIGANAPFAMTPGALNTLLSNKGGQKFQAYQQWVAQDAASKHNEAWQSFAQKLASVTISGNIHMGADHHFIGPGVAASGGGYELG